MGVFMLTRIDNLEFKTVNLAEDSEISVKFREDSFVASFGNADLFYEEDGKGDIRYLEFLAKKIQTDPRFAVHVWENDQIIGQVEIGTLRTDPSIGYVNLYYLKKEKRGHGYAPLLDQYTSKVFKEMGLKKARLSVSPTNARAIKFYERMKWIDLGPREDHPEVHFMEKII